MRVKLPAGPAAPRTLDEADGLLARLGVLARERQLIDAQLDEDTAHAKAAAERAAAPIDAEVLEVTRRLQAWAEANRDQLTNGGRTKTVALPAGKVFWRKGRARLVVTDEGRALQFCESDGGYEPFVARKVALDKAALLKAPDCVAIIPGLEIQEGAEEFVAEPVCQALSGAKAREGVS